MLLYCLVAGVCKCNKKKSIAKRSIFKIPENKLLLALLNALLNATNHKKYIIFGINIFTRIYRIYRP